MQQTQVQCRNHPETPAVARCAGCAEPFCAGCMIEIQGQKYCGACKVMTLQGRPMPHQATKPCAAVQEAFTCAIVGMFVFGIILGPVAIAKAIKAKNQIQLDPRLGGSGKATGALVGGIAATVFGAIGSISWIRQMGS